MNTSFPPLSLPIRSSFNNESLSAFNFDKRKALMITLIAIGSLGAGYFLSRYCFKAKPFKEDDQKESDLASTQAMSIQNAQNDTKIPDDSDSLTHPLTQEENIALDEQEKVVLDEKADSKHTPPQEISPPHAQDNIHKSADDNGNLAPPLPQEEDIQLLDEVPLNVQQYYLKSIERNPQSAEAYYNLATTLDNVSLPDGTLMTERQLYLKAIELDPNFANAYYNLARTLYHFENIKLLNGTILTVQKLYLQTIALDPHFADAYHNLALTMPRDHKRTIQLLDGTALTRDEVMRKADELNKQLTNKNRLSPKFYLKSIQDGSLSAILYVNLAKTLPLKGNIQLLDETIMTQQELYLKAIQLDPNFAPAYCHLGPTVHKIKLFDGIIMTQQELLLKAIQLDPHFAPAYCHLALTPPPERSLNAFELPDGTSMNKQKLLLKAIELDRYLAEAYHHLATTLFEGGSITFHDETKLTKQELYQRAEELRNT